MVESNISLDHLVQEEPPKKSHSGCGSCGSGGDGSKCGNGLEKIYPTTAVRFGYLRYIGEFSHPADMKFTCGARVVIQTRRGIEMGEQVSLTCSGCDKSVSRDQMKDWVSRCGEDSFIFDAGRILREATAADLAEYARIQYSCKQRKEACQRLSDEHNLPIKIVDCESPFGGERIIFFFSSEERVDFRGLVRDLSSEFQTRIEMRQVGARDEARLLADFETCGREVCCKVFLKTLRPITMRMAKLQKATLDPTQVSGRCGRLKCCLRYEHVGYEELDAKLPRNGLRIRTNHGDGVIVNRQVLTQLVQIRKDDGSLVTVVAEDIVQVGIEAPPPPAVGEDGGSSPPGRVSPPPRRRPSPPMNRAQPPQKLSDLAFPQPTVEKPNEPSTGGAPLTGAPNQQRPQRRGKRRRGRRGGLPQRPPGPGGSGNSAERPPEPPPTGGN